jgi:S-ribosylhomocysteine lyase
MFGYLNPEDIYDLVIDMCDFIIGFTGEIPGAKAEECGNYLEQNLPMAKYYIEKYKNELITHKRFIYN